MGATTVVIQNSLSAGELAPGLLGRQDLQKVHDGTSTCRNFFSNYKGGVSSRAGLAYIGMCKQAYPTPPRDIPFQFSLTQGYALEFGELYMRVKYQGAYVTEAAKSASVNTSGVFTVTSHGYSNGDWVYDSGNTGFSGLTWIIQNVTTNTFTVTDLFGNAVTSATSSSGGTVARIYTVVSPYHAVDLPYLKYTQSADVMTLTCVNPGTSTEYPPYDLQRLAQTNWTFTQTSFGATISKPTGLTGTATSSTTLTTYYTYVVTAVDSVTGEESVASSQVSVFNNDIALYAGSNTLTWNAVSGADSYNVYAAVPRYQQSAPVSSLFGFIGRALGPSFTDTNITPDFTQVPPTHYDPFARGAITDVLPTAGGSNYSQSTIGWSLSGAGSGTGFDGYPVVSNGSLAGFVITNQGQNYPNTVTIGFTDSGGGLATGNFVFSGNPSNTSNIIFNGGTVITFKNSPSNPADVQIGQTLALTLQALANFLNSQSTNINLSVATYTYDATHLYITYKTPGTVGNAYTLANGSGTTNATASGANLTGGGTTGSGATATLTVSPQTGTYPGVCAYYSQRRVYANSLNDPDTYWMSQPGLFQNFDSSIPVTDGDSISGTPWAQQVNGIQFLTPMPGGLVVLTGRGAWQVNGGSNAAVTPSNQTATPQAYNGSHNHVPPIIANYDVLYVQSRGSIIRDLSYNFFINIYTGTDLTVLSNHLFQNYQIVQWAYAEEPYKLIWTVRNDGVLLCLTYLKEQEIYSWTRHDTNGLFVGVCTVTEPVNSANVLNTYFIDAPYFIVQRYVQGAWRYYSERMDNRLWTDAESSFCVDAGLQTPLTYPNATLSVSGRTGTVTLTTDSGVFNSGQSGQIVRCGGGVITLGTYNSSTSFTGTVTTTIAQTVQDDPNNLPIPFPTGEWSMAPQVTSVSGLNHLNGLTVAILADGSVVDNQVVTNNSVTLPAAASLVTVGLPYTCQVQTMYLDHPGEAGSTVQNRRKNISAIGVRVQGTRGIQVGANQPDQSAQQNFQTLPWTDMVEVKDRTQFDYAGTAVPLFTGDYYQTITSNWDLRGQAAIQQQYPLPANILSLVSYVSFGDDRG